LHQHFAGRDYFPALDIQQPGGMQHHRVPRCRRRRLSQYTGEKNATYEEPRQHCGDGRFCSHNTHDNTTSERKTPFPETGRDDGSVIGNLRPDFPRVRARWEEILALLGQRALLGRVTRWPLRLRFNLVWLAAGKHRRAESGRFELCGSLTSIRRLAEFLGCETLHCSLLHRAGREALR